MSSNPESAREVAWPPAPANGMTEDVIFEASAISRPVIGIEPVQELMKSVSGFYSRLDFTAQVVDGATTYIQWNATMPSGTDVRGVTTMTRNTDGLIEHVAVHQRPLHALHEFSIGMGERLRGVTGIDPDIFYVD